MSTDRLPFVDMARVEAERDELELAIHAIARVRIMDSLSAIHMRAIAYSALRKLYSGEERAA